MWDRLLSVDEAMVCLSCVQLYCEFILGLAVGCVLKVCGRFIACCAVWWIHCVYLWGCFKGVW